MQRSPGVVPLGLSVMCCKRRLRPGLPIVLNSGQFGPEDAAEARRVGIRWAIAKSEAFEQIPLEELFPAAPV